MNKKLLICGAIATSLLLSACVKKETPAEEETRAETATTQSKPEAKFENLSPTEPEPTAAVAEQATAAAAPKAADTPKKVEVIREQTANTTTEIRRETRPAQTETQPKAEAPKPEPKAEVPKPKAEAPKPEPKAEAPKAEPKPKAEAPRSNSTQSQDDAVAAAIAAATPALD
ncbi:internalin [Acinetobacter sp. B51(2017)]|uniref:internalin n=1 Tax=Acinetobacter sp. B51(2017) TaxID=2060938 RepID=UPI000F07518E|nr:internalin [Acinetobacter sp. B51(2017)]